MPTTVVVGGQYGGEGKGKITSHIIRTQEVDLVVRCGGPNSGHTVTLDGKQTILRQVPAGVVKPGTKMALAAGCLIDEELLLEEIGKFRLTPDDLLIDKNAIIIKPEYRQEEMDIGLKDRISSTCTGTGVAVAKRTLRDKGLQRIDESDALKPFATDVAATANNVNNSNGKVLVEGTQGFGLSLYHSPYYPFTTSRDTTASAFLSEVGISPITVEQIILVIRTFPIRVGGPSGPLFNETSWDSIREQAGTPYLLGEFTSVTQTLRRVGNFDWGLLESAIKINSPTGIALTGTDYLDYKNYEKNQWDDLTSETQKFCSRVEEAVRTELLYIGTGPSDYDIIQLSNRSIELEKIQ